MTKWGKDIDTNRWGMVETDEVKDLINFLGWGTPQSALHQQSSDTAAPSTVATATTTSVSTATTAAQSRPATATATSVSTATTAAPSGPATAPPLQHQVQKQRQAQVEDLTHHQVQRSTTRSENVRSAKRTKPD